MKKLAAVGMVVAIGLGLDLAAVTLRSASAEKSADRPFGVAADHWFPINDHSGLVLSEYQPGIDPMFELPRSPAMAPALPALNGYLLIKQNGHWTRVFVITPPKLPTP